MTDQLSIDTPFMKLCNDECDFEPPPDDIMFMPPPPLPPSIQALLMPQRNLDHESEVATQYIDAQCNYCSIFDDTHNDLFSDSTSIAYGHYVSQSGADVLIIIGVFLVSLIISVLYCSRSRNVAISVKKSIFKNGQSRSQFGIGSLDNTLQTTLDPSMMPMNLGKTTSSPNIITDVPHKKSTISSKHWQQTNPVSGLGQMNRIVNDYEIILSRINSSACTPSAAYSDIADNGQYQARLFSIYDLHNYAPNEQAF